MNQNPGIVSSGLPVVVTGTVTANLGTIDGAATEATLLGVAGLVPAAYDFVDVTFTDATKSAVSVVVFRLGGSGGTIVATITAAYPSSTRETYTKT